jgi:hypothetical protein
MRPSCARTACRAQQRVNPENQCQTACGVRTSLSAADRAHFECSQMGGWLCSASNKPHIPSRIGSIRVRVNGLDCRNFAQLLTSTLSVHHVKRNCHSYRIKLTVCKE